jgi:trk system potassium uptake protein TrkH
MGNISGKFSSLTAYATDPLVSLTIAGLILCGGVGFCVWDDLLTERFRVKKCRLHTKAVLIMTGVLLGLGTFLYLFFERNNPIFADYTFGEKLLVAVFNATTPRTAGFNTVNFASLSDSSYLLTVTLMFIGGSSGSTAGGVKVTTLFVIVMGIFSVLRGKQDVEVGKRRVHNALLRQALAVFVSCLFLIIVATLCICTIEANNPSATLQAVLFETVSALATVGLSLSLTPTLSVLSKLILILLMYAGRVGILTVALAFAEQRSPAKIRKPVDNLMIG